VFRKALQFIFRDTVVYGISGALSKFFAIIVVPILTRTLTQEQFGIFDAVQSLTLPFTAVIVLGQDSAIARYLNEHGDDLEYRRKVVTTGLALQILPLLVFIFGYFLFSKEIAGMMLSSEPMVIQNYTIAMLSVPGAVLYLFSINLFKWMFRRWAYVFLTVGSVVLTVATTIVCVVYLKLGVAGAIIPIVLSNTIFGLIGLFMNFRMVKISKSAIDLELVRMMFKYGTPLMIVSIVGALIPSIDRMFLSRSVSFDEIGAYALNIKIAGLMGFAISSFEIAFVTYAFSIWKEEYAPGLFSRVVNAYMFVTVSLAVYISGFGIVLVQIFGTPAYIHGLRTLPFLLLAAIMKGGMAITLLGVYYSTKSILNLWIAIIGIAVSVAANSLFVPILGIVGAAIALFLSHGAMNTAAGFFSSRYYAIVYQTKKLLLIILFAIPTFLCTILEVTMPFASIMIAKYVTMFLFPIVMWIFVLEENEKKSINEIRQKILLHFALH
jgi:O-antigen/teichoic acid export membrane protein